MPDSSITELQGLRNWRTWLLIVTGGGQGVQNVLNPHRALIQPGYARLVELGDTGWRVLGLLLIAVTVLLIGAGTRPAGHACGFALYLFLVVAVFATGSWPALSLLATGLHGGEFFMWAKRRREMAGCGSQT